MNERIKQLAKKSGCSILYDYDMDGHAMVLSVKDMEKFAELIVRECAEVSEDDVTDGYACCTNTADRIARQIKKHFGVEE